MVTLSVFPSVISGIKSKHKDDGSLWTGLFPLINFLIICLHKINEILSLELGKFFTPVVCFLVFNVGDFCGRLMAGIVQKVSIM